jgi:hypothetical protein
LSGFTGLAFPPELFKAFLKKIGFSRVVVGTAKDAISSLRKQKFDLMFFDLRYRTRPEIRSTWAETVSLMFRG